MGPFGSRFQDEQVHPAKHFQLKESFRSRVLSGLLMHLCPPSGQFADLFGLEEDLRSQIFGMLGARDLSTFGLVREREGEK